VKSAFRVVGFLFMLLVLFAFGFAWRDLRNGDAPSKQAFASLLSGLDSQKNITPTEEFTSAYEKIRSDYYKPVPSDKLTYAGMEGLMASLGDPHTMFLEPKQAQEFNLETKANFVGVGARLSPDPLGAKIGNVFDNGPADKAGMKAGDIITAVNGKTVVGMNLDDIVSHIRGEEGTQVQITLIRVGKPKPFTISVTRAHVVTPTVLNGQVLPGTELGYFEITSFSEPTAEQFDAQVAKLEKQHIKGLILDVRDNPGGLLETAVDMLSRFVEDKVVVRMKGRNGQEDVASTYTGAKHNFSYPIAILMNEDSASAAEIFSGVLQDYKLVTLVGTHSYGKASVQNVTALVGGSSAKITIARYYLPSMRDIGRKVDEEGQYISGGLQPDVKAELDLDKQAVYGDMKTDTQLQKAVQVLQAKIQP
jgi:carboxyl-terminal processing protease